MNSVQIIDNFFEDPDKIVKWANTLSYKKDIKKRWPGKRCCVCEIALHNEDNNFVKKFIEKILSIKYPNNKVNCEGIEIYFQKIEPIPGVGVIHKDDMALAGLIYLTKDANLNSGTSIFNDASKETINISNVYNRLIMYDGNPFHRANHFHTGQNERLTLVWFIKNLYES